MAIRFLFVILAMATFFPCPCPAEEKAALPTKIVERSWADPGPRQDGKGAPKLLVVYPIDRTRLGFADKLTRYAGRVDPPGSRVLLDGKPVKVYPGGVFTGLVSAPVGERAISFKAESGGKSTAIRRTIIREDKVEPPDPWPLAFNEFGPVSPSGEYWLRPGSTLEVKLRASAGHRASWRLGGSGDWLSMKPALSAPGQGGAYSAEIAIDASAADSEPQAVEFMLAGSERKGGAESTLRLVSKLKIKRLAADLALTGRVTKSYATFLKFEDGWERHGNWILDSPFPIAERRGERFKVDFGRGEPGFVELENSSADPQPGVAPRPALVKPAAVFSGEGGAERVEIEWNCPQPIASVFHAEGDADRGTLTVNLIGAASAQPCSFAPGEGRFIKLVEVFDAAGSLPPRVEIKHEGRELWGYEWTVPAQGKLRLMARVRPTPPKATKAKPLGGLKILVDAGHGGFDTGAIGPSGLNEKDLNLVLSGFLGERLRALGAEIKQARTSDLKVELDARVDDAIAFDADLFISVHHNSVPMTRSPLIDKGPIVFYHYAHSEALAAAISEELAALLIPGLAPRVTSQNFRVNRNVSFCPSVLIEGGFVCNPEDEIRLRQVSTLKKMAEASARGIQKIIGRPN